MKILIVTGIFPPDIGGPASYVPKIAAHLAGSGNEVTVLTLSETQEAKPYPFSVVRVPRNINKAVRFVRTLVELLRHGKGCSIFYVNGLVLEARLASWLLKIPVICKIVGDTAWERARNRGWFTGTIDAYQVADKGFFLKLLDAIRSIPLRSAKRILVPSRYLKRIVQGWGIPESEIDVIYNGVHIPKIEESAGPLPPRNAFQRIVTICRLVPWKGVDGILKTLVHLPGAELIVVGDGPLRKLLESTADQLGIANRVSFLGNLDKKSTERVLANADAFVLNSTYEGLPHVVLEALALGIPVIATDVGGTGEVIEDGKNGFLIRPGDGGELLNRLTTVLGFSEKRYFGLLPQFEEQTMLTLTADCLQRFALSMDSKSLTPQNPRFAPRISPQKSL